MLKRFGGQTNYGQGFINVPKNSSFYAYKSAKEQEMNSTFNAQKKKKTVLKKVNADLEYGSMKSKKSNQQNLSLPSDKQIIAKEVSVGSNTQTKTITRTALLGPTEYLSLSSGYATPDEKKNTNNKDKIMIHDEKSQTVMA